MVEVKNDGAEEEVVRHEAVVEEEEVTDFEVAEPEVVTEEVEASNEAVAVSALLLLPTSSRKK